MVDLTQAFKEVEDVNVSNSNVDLAFKVFIGLCSCLNLMGLICTSRRYYKRCIDGRRVYDDGGV